MKKTQVMNAIIVWIICFAVLSIIARGMGILEFEKKQCDINEFTGNMDSAEIQQGRQYKLPDDENILLLDFSVEHSKEPIYGVELAFGETADIGALEAYFSENAVNSSDEEWQAVTIEHKDGKMEMRFTKGHGCLKLCTDRLIELGDVVSFAVITKSSMVKVYIISGVFALCISILFAILKKDSPFQISRIINIVTLFKTKKVMITLASIFVECLAICIIEATCYVYVRGYFLNPCRVFMVGCMAAFLTVAFRHKEIIIRKFHIFYFFLMFTTGSVYILGCAPYSLDLSWDDQVHYARVNYVARGFHSYETEAGYQLKAHYFDRGTLEDNFTEEKRIELAQYIGSLDKNKDYGGLRIVDSYYSLPSLVSYVPAAIGLIIGRGLGLPTMMTLLMGRWANLLCYALILSYAVWLLRKRGYIVAAFIGLIPVAVFLASNYSYDWWLTSLSILGYALLEQVTQEKNKRSHFQMLKIMLVMFLAILPKAVYVTIIIPMITVFAAKGKKNKIGLLAAALIFILLAASFIVPGISSGGAAYSDMRGGSDVNSIEQIRFILTKPLEYSMILARFLWRYINPDHSVDAFGYYILFGTGKFWSVVLILLVTGTIVDNINYKAGETGRVNALRLWSVVAILSTLVLISTAMYVSYTPVMSKDIVGVQARYSIPLFFPLLFYVCRMDMDIPQRIKNNVAVYGSMLLAAILCFNIYVQCICFY